MRVPFNALTGDVRVSCWALGVFSRAEQGHTALTDEEIVEREQEDNAMPRSRRLSKLEAIHRRSKWVVEFDNPAIGPVDRGFPSWAEAMRYAASRRKKYGCFDGYEKPRVKRSWWANAIVVPLKVASP
jgi:hypothetical protein